MNRLIYKNFIDKKNILYLFFFLFATFPIAIITGNLLINIYIILIALLYLGFYLNKKILRNKSFLILTFFFITILINCFFSNNLEASYPRVVKMFFIIFFILSFQTLINYDKKFEKKLYKFWLFIIIFFTFDLIVEIIFSKNILGVKSYIPGRLSGLFGDELVAGYFFLGFGLISLIYIYKNITNNVIIISLILVFMFIISFLIGERSNFLKLSLGLFFFSFFFYKKYFLNFILLLMVLLLSLFYFTKNNKFYEYRYVTEVKKIYNLGFKDFLKNSQYGAHYNTAYKVFQNNKYFGVGIKNFRYEGHKGIYHDEDYVFANSKSNTHPHQIHFEFLSETGLFGYIAFLIFIIFSLLTSLKNYKKTKNYYQIAGAIFIVTSLLPYLPSGSFFSTFNSSIFWLNYAIMMGYNEKKN